MKLILTTQQADTYRYTTAGTYSAPFHFIDALDSPPSSCGVEYDRDCGSSGCVVSAINNYVSFNILARKDIRLTNAKTTRVQKTSLSSAERIIAAKVSLFSAIFCVIKLNLF